MENESIFETSSSDVDSISDSASYLEADAVEQGSDESVQPDSELDTSTESESAAEPVQSSLQEESGNDEAVTVVDSSGDLDNSSFYAAVLQNQRDTITEVQRVEGYSISILYTLYILLALLISGWILKWITHFTNFD